MCVGVQAHDKPLRFGVEEFCEICNLCASGCPAAAIPHGKPSRTLHNQSNIQGVKKWSVDGEKCFKYCALPLLSPLTQPALHWS